MISRPLKMRQRGLIVSNLCKIHGGNTIEVIMLIAVWIGTKQLIRLLKHLATKLHLAFHLEQGLYFVQQNSRKLLFSIRMA